MIAHIAWTEYAGLEVLKRGLIAPSYVHHNLGFIPTPNTTFNLSNHCISSASRWPGSSNRFPSAIKFDCPMIASVQQSEIDVRWAQAEGESSQSSRTESHHFLILQKTPSGTQTSAVTRKWVKIGVDWNMCLNVLSGYNGEPAG